MKIEVTKDEFDAICFARSIVDKYEETDLDLSCNALVHSSHLFDLEMKCQRELARDRLRKELTENVKELYPNKNATEVRRLVNKVMRIAGP